MAILILQDLIDVRKRKQKELEFYTAQKKVLEMRLQIVSHELALTDKILRMIDREELIDLHKHNR
jgi:hypothetical protein